jgi:CubicO group peptidase (beta-lactamase class C family)
MPVQSNLLPELQGFEDFVNKQLELYHVPGAAVAIVRGGEMVFAGGFGKRDVARDLPVSSSTVMPIGSTTKSFTTLATSTLVEEGKLDWDRPVRTYIPTFRMADSFATERMTLRDMACHRSGLPRHELAWMGSPFSREELLERLQYLEPNKDFRSAWQYQNVIYMSIGCIAGKVAGSTWERLVTDRVLEPLGMTSAGFSLTEALAKGDAALPYFYENGQLNERAAIMEESTIGPAGSICANVLDMAKYLQLHLGNGTVNGRKILSDATLKLLHTPQMTIQDSDPISEELRQYRELGDKAYAFGWQTGTYRGRRLVEHGGNTDGHTAACQMLPDDGIGVIVLTNLDHTELGNVISYNVFDRLLGLDQVDWSSRFLPLWQKMLDLIAQMKQQAAAERKEGTTPSHPLADYVGEYEHPGYGTFSVSLDGDRLKGYYNGHDWPIRHHHFDVFAFDFWLMGMSFLGTFQTDVKGNVHSLVLPLESTVKDIVFTRKAGKEMSDTAFLSRFAGDYELMGMTLGVELKQGVLFAAVPGQGEQELVGVQGTEFQLKNVAGITIEFKIDPAGKVVEAVVNQGGMAMRAKRVG